MRERRRESDISPPAGGPPSFAGWYTTDGQGMVMALMDDQATWLPVTRAIFAPTTYGMSQRPPETYEARPMDQAESAQWIERCEGVARGRLVVTEGELGEAVELSDRETGEVVWESASH